jgi:hypothetical protein
MKDILTCVKSIFIATAVMLLLGLCLDLGYKNAAYAATQDTVELKMEVPPPEVSADKKK